MQKVTEVNVSFGFICLRRETQILCCLEEKICRKRVHYKLLQSATIDPLLLLMLFLKLGVKPQFWWRYKKLCLFYNIAWKVEGRGLVPAIVQRFSLTPRRWSLLPYETPYGSPKLLKHLNFLNFIDEEIQTCQLFAFSLGL